jgi:UDP-N-acetylmuramoylalanine--D-glutamate ligase
MMETGRRREELAGKRVHVIGLGAYGTGRETARVLAARGARVTVSDAKPAEELSAEIEALKGTGVVVLTGSEAYLGIEESELVVPSPGVPLTIPALLRAREAGARIVSEIEVAFWLARCPILAVTGTKGKSTTTALLGELLRDEGKKVRVGGNIGRPLIALADRAGEDEILVAEVSSFQLESTESFRPRVAVLLNLFADHLDRHADMAEYTAAKARIFANQESEDAAVINRGDKAAWALRERTRARVVPFSLDGAQPEGADVTGGWLRVERGEVCREGDVRLRGRHNLANALAALAAARCLGASLERAGETLARFEGLEHRLEPAGVVGGVTFINDSQATTPESAVVALEAFPEHVVLIAGGRPKVHDFAKLGSAMAKSGADLVVIGEAADEIAAAARAAAVKSIVRAGDLREAVERAFRRARPGDVVLLSPACASFDMFANMAERGRAFKGIAAELAAEEGKGE